MDATAPACLAIGIDLGTAYTCVAVYRAGRAEIIPDHGQPAMPSVVAFTSTTRLIGSAAKNQAHANPSNTIFDALRFLGRDFADPEIQSYIKYCPFTVVQKDGVLRFQVEYKGSTIYITPAEIVSMILARAKENAEEYLGHGIDSTALTIPSLFKTRERQMIRDIALAAGLKVLYLIDGAMAAAVHYSVQTRVEGERNLLFYDLGAATLSVTLLTVEEGIVEVKAGAGDRSLGGLDFDHRLLVHCGNIFTRETGIDNIISNPRCLSRLRAACERAKRELSSQQQTLLEIDSLYGGVDFRTAIHGTRFDELCQDLFRSTLEPVERVLRDAKMDKTSVHEIVMAGGSSRIPKIQKLVSDFFNSKEVSKSLNADEAAACGASIVAAIFSGYNDKSRVLDETLLLDCVPVTLGVESPAGIMTPMVKRNTTRPTKKSEVFGFNSVEGASIQVSIFEGERARTKDNLYLGQVELHKPSNVPAGHYEFEVTFDVDAHDRLAVSLSERLTGSSSTVSFDQVGCLPEAEIKRMQLAAGKFKADEEEEVRRISERDALELFAYQIKEKFSSSNSKGQAAARLMTMIDSTIEWLDDHPSAETEEYVRRKMDLQRELSLAETVVRDNPLRSASVEESIPQQGNAVSGSPERFVANADKALADFYRQRHKDLAAEQRRLESKVHNAASSAQIGDVQALRERVAELERRETRLLIENVKLQIENCKLNLSRIDPQHG